MALDPVLYVAAVGAAVSILKELFDVLSRSKRQQTEEAPEDRVKRLTTSLREATTLIEQIQREIADRTTLASKLQADIDQYEKLAQLKKTEVEGCSIVTWRVEKGRPKFLLERLCSQLRVFHTWRRRIMDN